MYARHVRNFVLRDVDLQLMADDARPAVYLEDAVGARFSDVRLPRSEDGRSQWSLKDVKGLTAREATGLRDEDFPKVEGTRVR